MRGLFFLILIVGAFWILDMYAFNGRYSQAAWAEARSQGQQLQYEVRRLLDKTGLGH